MRNHFTSTGMTSIQAPLPKKENNWYWWGCRETGTLVDYQWGCKIVQPLCQTVKRFLKKFKVELQYFGVHIQKT